MATQQTQKMPCGDVYDLKTDCFGMYKDGKIRSFCKKCPISREFKDSQWE